MAHSLSDDELLLGVREGRLDLYEPLVARYNKRLFRLIYPILKSRPEAEDVIQETHLRALTNLHQFEGRATFATWLARIGIYEALGRLRSRRRFLATNTADDNDCVASTSSKSADPEQEAMNAELRGVLRSTIRRLPQPYRSVVTLRLVQDMTTSETCAQLQLSEETVKTRLHRAKAMLRRELQCRLRNSGKNLSALTK